MTFRHVLLLATLCLGLSGVAQAGKAGDKPLPPREASQLVTGHIEVDAQGAVAGFTLDDRRVLPAQALAFLDRSIPQWRFKPVLKDGQPVAARSDMSLRLVLTPAGDKQYALGVRGVAFGNRSADPATRVHAKKLTPPEYPRDAMAHGNTGNVYLLVKVGRDGKVIEAVDEQVNLTAYDPRTERPEDVRADFVRAALQEAKRWKFTPPTAGDEVDKPFWTVRVPVVFSFFGTPPKPGEWTVYEPGPRRERPEWARSDDNPNFSPDALPPGDAYAGGQALHMLSMGGAP